MTAKTVTPAFEYNGIHTLLQPEQLEAYNKDMIPGKLELIASNLATMLAMEEGYEVFLPIVYFKQESHMKNRMDHVKVDPYKWLISNYGRVVNLRKENKPEFVEPVVNSSGYPEIVVKLSKGRVEHLALHRALACLFVPIPVELAQYHPKDLQVIHLDDNKANYELSNLQWSLPPSQEE